MALVATPGDPLANSYCSVADATAYLDERLHTEPWYAQNANDQTTLNAKREAALITATRLLDEQMVWAGAPTDPAQALAWPRTGVTTPAGLTVNSTTIPATLERATAYYALALLRDTSEAPGAVNTGTIKRQVLGETTIEYFDPGRTTQASSTPMTTLPDEIRQMLKGYSMVLGGVMMTLIRA